MIFLQELARLENNMTNLETILVGIDWKKNIHNSLGSENTLSNIDEAALRLAVWSKQLEEADIGNPALSFVREMQHSFQHSGALIGLCLYKPSAASSRTFLESCLYFSYFRTHLEELETLVSDSKYYIGKSEILAYHKQHTSGFKERQEALGLITRLDTWYSKTSAVVHGQIPGAWNAHNDLVQTGFSKNVHDLALNTLLQGTKLVNDILLCTVASRLWNCFASDAKTFLMKGIVGEKRELIGLDSR